MTGNNKLKVIIAIICLLFLVLNEGYAQKESSSCKGFRDTILYKFVYTSTDKLPEPEGGIQALSMKLSKSLRCESNDVNEYTSDITVAFVIEPNGKIHGGRLVKAYPTNRCQYDRQILEIVSRIKWTPAFCAGKAVPFLYTLPVRL